MATFGVEPAAPTASLRTTESRLIAPRFLGEGSNGVLDGSGFCDGTKVRVGNDLAEAAATVHDGGRTLRFKTPRLATPGPITILPPHGVTYQTADLEVDTFRSTRGAAVRQLRLRRLLLRGGRRHLRRGGALPADQPVLAAEVHRPHADPGREGARGRADHRLGDAGLGGPLLRHRARRPGLGAQSRLAAPLHHRRRVLADQERQRQRLPRRPARDPGVVAVPRRVVPALEGPARHSWNASARSSRRGGCRWSA